MNYQYQKTSKKYIFDPNNFQGNCLATINTETGKIDYTQMSWDEYNAANGGNLLALDWKIFYSNWVKPYLESIQKPWIKCTETEYDYSLGAVPPIHHRCNPNGFTVFCSGEATTHHLHQMFAHRNGKYWTALRSIRHFDSDIDKELLNLI